MVQLRLMAKQQHAATVAFSSPGKLLLYGEHAVVHGYPCLLTAVDRRLTVTVAAIDEPEFYLEAPDVGLESYRKPTRDLALDNVPKAVAYMEAVLHLFLQAHPQQTGVHVTTHSQFSHRFGFGSSSAVVVSFSKALSEIYQVVMTDKQLFALCHKAILSVSGVGSGADLATAIWGGTLYYVTPAKVVEPVTETASDLVDMPLLVGYTGIKADTATLVRMVNEQVHHHPKKIHAKFSTITFITEQARAALRAHDWPTAGKLMTENQALLAELGVSTVELDTLIEASIEAGAYGAKLSGGGGGDVMLAMVPPDRRQAVVKAIESRGGQVIPVTFDQAGLRAEAV